MTDPTNCAMNKQQLDVVLYAALCSGVDITFLSYCLLNDWRSLVSVGWLWEPFSSELNSEKTSSECTEPVLLMRCVCVYVCAFVSVCKWWWAESLNLYEDTFALQMIKTMICLVWLVTGQRSRSLYYHYITIKLIFSFFRSRIHMCLTHWTTRTPNYRSVSCFLRGWIEFCINL